MKICNSILIATAILTVVTSHVLGESVLTYHNNNARTGANTNETLLAPTNVNTNTFGLLMKYKVDGYVYAQPLYVSGLAIPGKGRHNVVFVATANNSVYAFDADSNAGTNGGLLWHQDLGEGIDLVTRHEFGGRYHNNVFQDMLPRIGITGTPVIDPVSGTLYVDAFTRTETEDGPVFHHKIHALSLTDGSERPFSPVEVAAAVPGSGIDSSNGIVTFNPRQHIQRPALTLAGGILYVGYGSAADTDPYHGWIMGYDARNLRLLTNSVFNTTPNATRAQFGSHAGEGALWMAGDGLCVDAENNLYFEVANGSFNAAPSLGNGVNYGDSFMKLSTAGNGLAVADYFTPFNQAAMQAADADFGSGGALLLPDEVGSASHPHLIVGGDKSSHMYLVDRDHMGRYNPTNNHQIVQDVKAEIGSIFSTPAYFNFHLYYQGVGGVMKAYAITNANIVPTPESATRTSFSGFGTTPSVSANGRRDAIVWTIQSDGAVRGRPAILHAYSATNLAQELYNSSQLLLRDNPGNAVKMAVPTVADGKVFIGTQDALAVFGNGTFLATPVVSPAGGSFNNAVTVTLSNPAPNADIFYTVDGTAPTIRSLRYHAPFTVTNSATVLALAVRPGAVSSGVVAVSFTNTAALGDGTGLIGEYWTKVDPADFTNQTFAEIPTLTNIEPVVDFDWRIAGTERKLGFDRLVARWTGSVQPQYTDTYVLAIATEGGVRLWENGQELINDWTLHTSTYTNQASVKLNAQQFYNLRLEYVGGPKGTVRLLWRRTGGQFAVIPQTQLYPRANPAPTVSFAAPPENAVFTATASVTIGAEANSAFDKIASVEFFANGKSLGALTRSAYVPVYALTVTGLAEGQYTLTSVATDGNGLSSTSAPVHIIVRPASGIAYGMTNRVKVLPFLKMPATFSDAVPHLLSGTGVFSDTAKRSPTAGLIPYLLKVPMWSDGAIESFAMAVPNRGDLITPEEQLRFRPTGPWKFPDGAVFIKNLDMVVDEIHPDTPRRRLETQVLVRDSSGAVYGATYKWRADNSDAEMITAGTTEEIAITNSTGVRTQAWYYASPADCLMCHTSGAGYVLGINTRQLNGSFTYPSTGNQDNQIRTWNRLGVFSPGIDEAKIPGFTKLAALTDANASLADRARSYLDVNCSQCHRPGGVGNYDARYETPLAGQRMVDAPAAVTLGLTDARIVKSEETARSVLYQRIISVAPAVKMPPLAHNQADAMAAHVIGEWINSLPVKRAE